MNHQRWAEEQRLFRHHLETLEDEIRHKLGPRYLSAFDCIKRDADITGELLAEVEEWSRIAKKIELVGDVDNPYKDPYNAIILWHSNGRGFLYKRIDASPIVPVPD